MDTVTALTEKQRTEVRELLKKISGNKPSTIHSQPSRATKRIKRIINPFDTIEEGNSVNGLDLSADCCTLTFVQRSRVCILPYVYDNISQERQQWIDMIYDYTGAKLSDSDPGTELHLRFIIVGNPPVKYLHIYLKRDKGDFFFLENFLYST
tara:strand:+ start:3513 stop:3968 length:456 start_codon:yes stop_codon:yes gene_type:complete